MGRDIIIEDVPLFTRRVGDQVFQGSNNTCIILGTDRAKKGPATVDDGIQDKGTGTIHLIAGRDKEDPNFDKDKAFIYLSMKTKVDDNLDLSGVESASNDLPAAVVKSDSVRIVFRKDIKIAFDGGKNYVHIDKDGCTINIDQSYVKIQSGKVIIGSGDVELGKNAQHKVILGDSFKPFFMQHKHPTGVGPSGPPIDPWQDDVFFSKVTTTE